MHAALLWCLHRACCGLEDVAHALQRTQSAELQDQRPRRWSLSIARAKKEVTTAITDCAGQPIGESRTQPPASGYKRLGNSTAQGPSRCEAQGRPCLARRIRHARRLGKAAECWRSARWAELTAALAACCA